MNWYVLVTGIIWWLAIDFLRGRINCPSSISLLLTLLAPIGAIICAILSFVL